MSRCSRRQPHITRLSSLSNPLSLFPIALAAGGGRVDDASAASLVAAGFTLLQRSAPLVRALAGGRSAILLPTSGAFLTALAASDGHQVVLLSSDASTEEIGAQLAGRDVRAVFTTRALAARLPTGDRAVVLLDHAPAAAIVQVGGTESRIDLGSHFGLDLEGEEDEGRDEECVIVPARTSDGRVLDAHFTHRNLLALARGAVDATSLLPRDHVLAALPPSQLGGFALTMAGPLLAGARVSTLARFSASEALRRIEMDGITMITLTASMYAALLDEMTARVSAVTLPELRVCVCIGTPVDAALQDRWFAQTGVELRQVFGVAEAPLALFNAPHFPNRRGTLGVPFPGVQVSIRDPQSGAALPRGVSGALCLRGTLAFSGYVRDEHGGLTVRDGWLVTRETARERADGAFELIADPSLT